MLIYINTCRVHQEMVETLSILDSCSKRFLQGALNVNVRKYVCDPYIHKVTKIYKPLVVYRFISFPKVTSYDEVILCDVGLIRSA